MLGLRPSGLLRRSPQVSKPASIPAPNGGVNRVDGLSEMSPRDAIFMYNMVPSELGTRVRTGYREWCTNVGTGGVRTIVPFTGAVTADDGLFGCAEDGIYDISASTSTPTLKLTFGTQDATSGLGISTNFINDSGAYFALYCDETNGYHVYTGATDTWALVAMGAGAGEIDGVDPANLTYVTIFKQRVWFIEKGTGNAWYLATNSIYGTATKFNFGNKFKHGGTLVALFNWTVDGGEGVDDYLIAVGSGGDVIVYKGTDPSDANNWFQHGSWFIGAPPSGRRIAGSFGGELYLLSTYGLLPMSKLISGALIQQEEVYLSKKITPLIKAQMLETVGDYGWEIKVIPSENLLLVSVPKQTGLDYTQFVYSLNTPGWALYRDVPYFTGEVWHENFYFADADGRVLVHTGDLDNVDLTESTSEQISWSVLMSFQGFGADVNYKRIQFIRPIFLAEQAPSYVVEPRYDYNLSEVFGAPAAAVATGAVWDTAVWDLSTWAGDYVLVDTVKGGSGMGRTTAIGLNGLSGSRTILVKFDALMDMGGLL